MNDKNQIFIQPDIDLSMSLLDYINPLNKVMDTVEGAVGELITDKDKANEIRGQVTLARITAQQQIERSYQIALQTVTNPYLDGLHKLARPIMGMVTLWVNYETVQAWMSADVELTAVHVSILALQWGPTGLYTAMKGRGKP